MAYKHGVYVREQETSLTPPIEGTAGLQVIFGTAPVNMTADPYKVANRPIICNSFAEAVAAVGYSDDFDKYTICQSIDASFRVFNVAPIILVNVLDPSNSKHVRVAEEDFLVLSNGSGIIKEGKYGYQLSKDSVYRNDKFYYSKDDSGNFAPITNAEAGKPVAQNTYERVRISVVNAFGVLIDKVKVKSEDGSTTFLKDKDYITSFDSDGYVVITALSTGAIKSGDTVRVSYSALNPDGVTSEDIIGGVNALTGEVSGLECVNKIFPMFGYTPGLLLAPGWATDANVIAAMEAKCTNINGCFSCNCLVDIGTDAEGAAETPKIAARKYSDTKAAKENLGIDSTMTFACWPCGRIGKKIYAMSALLGALLAYTDASNDDVPNVYPSNKSFGITGTCLADGTDIIIDQEQANIVNSYGIVTAINMNGYKCWGNNTAAYPSTTDPKDRWIAVRRMFTWWANTLILTYFQKVDDPCNYRLVENIVDSENIRGNSFVARGICAAAKVEFIASENPITSILNGKIVFHIHLSPYVPAEDIEFVLEFDPTAIQSALEGGNS